MDKLFKNHAQNIRVYTGKQTVVDYFEGNTTFTVMNPTPIKAIVTDLSMANVHWKMPGVIAKKAKEILTNKKHRALLELSYKIEIEGEDYYGWDYNGSMQLRTQGDYVHCYVYIKEEGQ